MTLQIPPNCDLTLGLTCVDKTTPGRSVWRVTLDERFVNPVGVVQGGFLSAIADSAMGASAVSAAGERKVHVANTSMKISFIRPARPGMTLTCTARVVKPGRVVSFVDARIEDDEGRLIATASSNYVISERTE